MTGAAPVRPDVDAGTLRATFRGHTRAVERIIYSPDGRTLASASTDGTVKLWNAGRAGQMTDQLHAEGSPDTFYDLSPDGRLLVIHHPDRFTMTFYDAQTLRPIAPPEDTRTAGRPVAFSPDGKALYRLAYDARHVAASHVRLVRQDLSSGRRSQVLTLPPESMSVDPLAAAPVSRRWWTSHRTIRRCCLPTQKPARFIFGIGPPGE